LWNGDVGVTLRDTEGRLRVAFESGSGEIRDFPPGRLSHVETAYALTVHKSQGSEFDRVLLALPDADTRLLSRELLYTGITRARHRLDVAGDPKRFAEGLRVRLPRRSGLAEALGLEPPPATPPDAAHEKAPAARKPPGPVQGELF
jgi:exodeoxyribonuclease V alpha subunit